MLPAPDQIEIKTYAQSKYCPEIVDRICAFLMVNPLRTHAAKHVEIGYDTFINWEDKYIEFKQRIKKAEEIGWKATHDDCVEGIRKEKSWFAKAWILERRFPEIWALKTKNEISGFLEQSEDDKDKMKRIYQLKRFLSDMETKSKSEPNTKALVKA